MKATGSLWLLYSFTPVLLKRSLWRQYRNGTEIFLCPFCIFSLPLCMTGRGLVVPSRWKRRQIMFIVTPESTSVTGQWIWGICIMYYVLCIVLCTVCHFLIRYHSSVFSSGSCVQELQRSSFIIFHSCQIHYMKLTETWKYFIFHRWSCWEQVVGTPMESITVLQLTALEKELKPKPSASENRTLHI